MRRFLKWTRRLVTLLIFLTAVVLVVQRYVLPWYVRRQIVAAAEAAGLPISSLTVRDVGLNGSELTDIGIGARTPDNSNRNTLALPGAGAGAGVRVGRVRAAYTPATLRHAALTDITIDGLELPLALHGRELDLGPLGHIRSSGNAAGHRELPFHAVYLRASSIILDCGGLRLAFPLEATITNAGAGAMRIDGRLETRGGWLHVAAEINSWTGAYTADLDSARLDLGALLGVLPADVFVLPGAGGGTASLTLHTNGAPGGVHGTRSSTITFKAENAWFRGSAGGMAMSAVGGTLDLEATLGNDNSPQAFHARLQVAKAYIAGQAVTGFDLTADKDAHSGDLRFHGGVVVADVKVPTIQGVAHGLLGTPAEPLAVDLDLTASGPPPIELRRLLFARGVRLSPTATLSVALQSTAKVQRTAPTPGMAVGASDGGGTSGGRWEVELAETRLGLHDTDVILQSGDRQIRCLGIEGELRATGHIDGVGARLGLGGVVTLRDLVAPQLPMQLSRAPGAAQLVTLDLGAATLAGRLWGEQPSWKLDCPKLMLALPGAHVGATASGVDVPRLTGQLCLKAGIALTPSGGARGGEGVGSSGLNVQAAVLPGSLVKATQVTWMSGAQHLGAHNITLEVLATQPLATAALSPDTGDWQWRVSLPAKLSAEDLAGSFSGGVELKVPRAAITATADLHNGAAPALSAMLRWSDGELSQPATALRLTGITSAGIPLLWNSKGPTWGGYQIAGVQYGADHFPSPGIIGNARIVNTVAELTFDWSLLKAQSLQGRARLDLGGVPRGSLKASLPGTRIDDPNELPALLSALKDLTFTGQLAADIDVGIDGALVTPRIHAEVKDGTLAQPKSGISLEGLSGALTIDNFHPISSPGDQRLSASKVTFGKFVLADSSLAFRIEDLKSIFIEQFQGHWSGGQLFLHALRLNPAQPIVDTTLFFEGIDLGQMLEAVAPEYATGQGQFYGRLPLRIAWPKIALGDGFLYGAPGAGGLQIKDARGLNDVLAAAKPASTSSSDWSAISNYLVNALQNYDYHLLRIDLIHDQRGLVARISTSGKAHDPHNPIEITNLTVNLVGFEDLVNAYLGLNELLAPSNK